MRRILASLICFAFGFASLRAEWKATPDQIKSVPPPAAHPVRFSRDIQPIFEASCIRCHGRGRHKGGFRLDNRDTLLKGGDDGPAVVPGNSAQSYLVALVSGLDEDKIMPQKGSRLKPDQIGLLRAWIDQGLPWDAGVSLGRPPPVNLFPRRPAVPAAREAVDTNPIDRFLEPYFAARRFDPPPRVDDRTFARRVYLDAIGLIPAPEDLRAFERDHHRDKRARLVHRLLANDAQYAAHWLTFWNDALRNDYRGTGYIDNGRKQITEWLYSALATNMPFDRFVAQLVDPTKGSEGFVNGIVWRGVVNASQAPQMQAAQNISQVFMGVNLKCASCHDSFINDWTLADSYGLASVYADGPLPMYRCDKPTGETATMKFLYPELGTIDPHLSRPERLKRLAEIITQRQDARLARTMVNRLWAKFLGRGIIEPVDDMDQPAWDQDLLDWLASDLEDHGYDLKRTMALILTSRAYQLPAVGAAEQERKDYVFTGPVVRRMSAEEFVDALSEVTGDWHTLPVAEVDYDTGVTSVRRRGAWLEDAPAKLRWVWKDRTAATTAAAQTVYFRRIVRLPEKPTAAAVVATCDNRFKLYVNGKEVTSGDDHTKPKLADIRDRLVKGDNLFAVEAVNAKADDPQTANPAGLLLYARIRYTRPDRPRATEKVWDLGTDASWRWTTSKVDGWEKRAGDKGRAAPSLARRGGGDNSGNWQHAAELGDYAMTPWNLGNKIALKLSMAAQSGHVRAALVNADPLMTEMGRPNREQVVTHRPSAATTLQALELTNGSTLADMLKRGAENLLAVGTPSGRKVVDRVYVLALGRKPTASERTLAENLVGKNPRREKVEDLLWAVAMLPEFQLIY
ncbi:MAG: DUF1549 domain-containing protein [Verrucomicrobia bacterium]|nr:DUF1549 domain-containing protein [Verrucomicrobiota bacterium]